MDPVSIVAGMAALVFALIAMLQWRRASELEETVRQLEAKLEARLPPPEAQEADAEEPEAAEEEEEDADEEDPAEEEPEEPAEEEDVDEDDDEEELEAEAAPPEAEDEPEAEAGAPEEDAPEPPPKPDATPQPIVSPQPVAKPKPVAPKPDRRRQLALEVVTEAFETCRYLDFDAIVEKPSTYRVTVPMTAANADGVRFLEVGMFACLKMVKLEDDRAILHIDTSQGPP